MKSKPWLVPSSGLIHMFARMSWWVHHTPVSTTAMTTDGEPSVTSHAFGAAILHKPHWLRQLKAGSFGVNSEWTGKPVRTVSARAAAVVAPAKNVPAMTKTARRAIIRRQEEGAVRPINNGKGLRK